MKKKINFILFFVLLAYPVFAQNYAFNVKASFIAKDLEDGEERTSYFYINTQNGNVGLDAKAWQMLMPESGNMMIFTLIEYGKQMTSYFQIEGNKQTQVQPLGTEGDNYTASAFWKEFKKTGKRQTFGKYSAEEYVGTPVDGELTSLWVGEKVSNIRNVLQGDIVGFMGIGYLYKPDEKAYYLIVHNKTSRAEVTLLDITPFDYTFNGVGYSNMNTPTMPSIPGDEQPQNPDNLVGYHLDGYSCTLMYEQSIMVIEQSLPALREMLKSNEIPADQKNELRKQADCLERKLPILKKALAEAKVIDNRFGNNQQKKLEECSDLQDKYNEILEDMCQ